ncbi:MAG: AAA family ATPase [bacterium]
MHLKRLEITGFKSFAVKRVIEFDPGFTAIVGPNGSGKSNIVDAIRWVLGEQSMKTIRGKKSEDVIFSGSKQKGRLGMAEVVITFDNSDGQLPIDYREVEIMRRVFRNGDSDYMLNGSKVRLMDIQELLAKVGYAQRTYSIISQGMIDSILMSGQQERKELFEEASGIKQYQIKRNNSINKLEATKENLKRVDGLIKEIEPRLRMLKRQAGKAAKRDEIAAELKDLSYRYYSFNWHTICKELNGQEKRSEELHSREQNLLKSIERLSGNVKMRENTDTQTSNLQSIKAELQSLIDNKNQLKEKLAITEGRLEVESERELSADDVEIKRRVADHERDLEQLQEKLQNLENEILSKQNVLTAAESKAIKLNSLLSETRQKIAEITGTNGEKDEATINSLKSNFASLEEESNNLFGLINNFSSDTDLPQLKSRAESFKNSFSSFAEGFKKIIKRNNGHNLQGLQEQLLDLEKHKDLIAEEMQTARVVMARLETEKGILHNNKNNIEKELITLKEHLAGGNDSKISLAAKELRAEKNELTEKISTFNKTIAEKETRLQKLEEEQTRKQSQTLEMEQMLRDHQDQLNALKDEVRELDIKKARVETRRDALQLEIDEAIMPDSLEKLLASWQKMAEEVPRHDRGHMKERIQHLRKQHAAIGEIDPNVIEEYKEVDKRSSFLIAQHEDLSSASLSLRTVIKELDQTIARQFENAIKKINEGFQKYFEILFGGGSAKIFKQKSVIRKTEEENLTTEDKQKLAHEYYIEIKASPPGKKLKNLSMLSGGERALTSVALIFAIIASNPTPFIVLDEVDAALDEANSQRFGKILESVSKQTQFIAITHNRETMKKAGILYGVTMQDDGVSKMISVKLEEIAKDKVS